MLEKSVARAVDSADRKVNLVMSAIASIEERIESLTNEKADREKVALQVDMENMAVRLRNAIDQEVEVREETN
jgi:hypothetical protein